MNSVLLFNTKQVWNITPPQLPNFIKNPLKPWFKRILKDMLKLPNTPGLDETLEKLLSGNLLPTIETTTPGPFTKFNVDRRIRLKAFAGDADALKGIELGKIYVGFNSPATFHHPDSAKCPKITCSGCESSIVPVRLGPMNAFEVVAPTKGTLLKIGCRCVESSTQASFRARTSGTPRRQVPQRQLVKR